MSFGRGLGSARFAIAVHIAGFGRSEEHWHCDCVVFAFERWGCWVGRREKEFIIADEVKGSISTADECGVRALLVWWVVERCAYGFEGFL